MELAPQEITRSYRSPPSRKGLRHFATSPRPARKKVNAKNKRKDTGQYPWTSMRFYTDAKSAARAADIHDREISRMNRERLPNNCDQYLLNLWTLQQKGRYQK